MFGALTIIFWVLTYILIIVYGFRYWQERPILMPYVACCFNFGWEVNALIQSQGYWGFIAWTVLDVAIIVLNLHSIQTTKSKVFYCISIVASLSAFWMVFNLKNIDGKLISAYAIGLFMQLEYLIDIKRISSRGKTLIAITKLIGDFFALLCNYDYLTIIVVAAVLTLIVDSIYLFFVINDNYNKPTKIV